MALSDIVAVGFGGMEPEQLLGVLLLCSALLSVVLILALMPVLRRYALARPNARSSHRVPTPQGGGMAVIAAAFFPIAALILLSAPDFKYTWGGGWTSFENLGVMMIAACVLALVGAVDDIRPLPVMPRLLLQLFAVWAAIAATRFSLPIPLWLQLPILVLAGLWFVNLVNFMDGLDWITVAEMVPITAFIAFAGALGLSLPLRFESIMLAASLCGALLGFALFNKPVARLFLGDVGSLPIGLLVGWLLLQLAGTGALAAAILLPLYYLADATITLLRRLAGGERVWEAHRSHFYQQATTNGFSPLAVSAHVFGLNLVLAALAALTLAVPEPPVQIGALVVGLALVGVMLRRFARARPVKALTETSR